MNILKLKGKLVEQNIKMKCLASAMGISAQALNRKFRGITRFNVDDIKTISDVANLDDSEKIEIFLP